MVPVHFAYQRIVPRGPGFNDNLMVHLLPPPGRAASEGDKGLLKSDLMCKDSQRKPDPDKSPRLQATAGGFVALRYQENGHVTLPENAVGKAKNRGTVFIYGTSEPSETDTFLAIHKQWNSAGTGGDKRGRLLASQDYDDTRCYQINGGSISVSRQKQFPHQTDEFMGQDIWCQNNIRLPTDLPVGKPFTLYWVWDWATLPNVDPGLPDGKLETYTTCMDVDITGRLDNSRIAAVTNAKQKNVEIAPSANNAVLNNAAIPKYMNELLKEAVAPNSSDDAASQPPSSEGPEATSSEGPEESARSPAPETPASALTAAPSQVTVTVTEKPEVVSADVTVMVSKSPTFLPTTIVTVPRSTLTVVGKTVTMTAEPSPSPSDAAPASPESAVAKDNSTDGAISRRCESCRKHKRSRIIGSARHRH